MDNMSDEVKQLILAVNDLVRVYNHDKRPISEEKWDSFMRHLERKLQDVFDQHILKKAGLTQQQACDEINEMAGDQVSHMLANLPCKGK